MKQLVLTLALCCATAAGASDDPPAAPRPFKPVPSVPKDPRIDGQLGDLRKGFNFAPTDGPKDAWTGRVAYRKDTLFLGVDVTDDKVLNGDIVSVSIYFPEAGLTARGYEWRFAVDGLRIPSTDEWPTFRMEQTRSKVAKTDSGLSVEAAIPARALPRFPAKEPMIFELCVTFEDRDEQAASPVASTNCKDGTMTGHALRLPDDFRKSLKLKPHERVVGLAGRKHGWVGYAVLHYPVWVTADVPLTATVLRALVADESYDPKKAGINLPDALALPGGETVLSVLSGKDPYEVEGKCEGDRELRFALYLVKGRTAERVLEWPASTCGLGRAVAFELDESGSLTVGYTLGSSATFVWSKDHFERTEIGSR